MHQQQLEQRKLGITDRQRLAGTGQRALAEIDAERAEGDRFAVFGRRRRARQLAAQHGIDACQQFARRKRLAKVIVGADLKPDDAVDLVAAGREQDHRDVVVLGAQVAQRGQAVDLGHHQVQHDQRRALALQARLQAVAVMHHRDGKALLGQVLAQQVAKFGIVVDDEDLGRLVRSHRHMIVSPGGAHAGSAGRFCFRRLHLGRW
ncbi:hypothetical protein D9M72_419050 [compost metagenome]